MAHAILRRAQEAAPVKTGRLRASVRILGDASKTVRYDKVKFKTRAGKKVSFNAARKPRRFTIAVGGIAVAGVVKEKGKVRQVDYAPIVELRLGWFGKVLREAVPVARRFLRSGIEGALHRYAVGGASRYSANRY